jgi:O-antigen ligase
MPLYVVRFRVGPLPTTLLEVLILVTVALYALSLLQAGAWRLRRTAVEIPMALFLVAAAVACAVSVDHVGALGLFRAYFVEPIVIFYIALDVLDGPRDLRLAVFAFLAGATLFALLNLGAWAITLYQHRPVILTDAPTALYASPNSVALFLEPAVATAAGLAMYADARSDRAPAAVALCILLPAMVLTLSRAGLLTLAVLALVAVATIPNRRVKAVLLAGAIVAGLAISRVPWVAGRLAHQLDPGNADNTLEGRLRIWNDTLHMLRDHPVFGAGLRAFTQVVTPYVTDKDRYGVPLYAHDVWLSMWSEIGLVGMVAFAALLVILLWRGWRGFAATGGLRRALLWGTSAAFVAIVVHGMFDTPYFNNDLSLEFWMLAALEFAALGAAWGVRATRQRG